MKFLILNPKQLDYLSGIRYHYIKDGQGDPLKNCERLTYILRGFKKSQNNHYSQRLPITFEVLQKLCTVLKKGAVTNFVDHMLLAACTLAFYGFLRCGEFTRKTQKQSIFVQIRDIHFQNDKSKYSLNLRSSKCDPFKKGICIDIYENESIFPVKLMYDYIQLRVAQGANSQSPLFLESEFDKKALSRKTFINWLKEVLLRIGYNDTRFNGHSFRIGAATSAASSGVGDHLIKKLGRWSSDCYVRYIRTDPQVIKLAQQKIGL